MVAQGKKPYSMDLLQMFYSELCDANHGSNRDTKDCPGLDKGGAWLFGDATNDDPSQGGKGYVKVRCHRPFVRVPPCPPAANFASEMSRSETSRTATPSSTPSFAILASGKTHTHTQ